MMIKKRCPYCKGQGAVPDDATRVSVQPCPVCNQRGYNLVPDDALICGLCQGTGRSPGGGKGWRVCPEREGIGSKW